MPLPCVTSQISVSNPEQTRLVQLLANGQPNELRILRWTLLGYAQPTSPQYLLWSLEDATMNGGLLQVALTWKGSSAITNYLIDRQSLEEVVIAWDGAGNACTTFVQFTA